MNTYIYLILNVVLILKPTRNKGGNSLIGITPVV